MYSAELIPAKFLILTVHFIVCTLLLWNSPESTKACLPEEAPHEAFQMYHTQLKIGLSVSIGMIGFELLVFVTGLTMFYPTSGLLSVVCHAAGAIALSCLVLDNLKCGWFWWIFAFGSAIPLINDACTVFDIVLNRKY